MNSVFLAVSDAERENILSKHREVYNGYQTLNPNPVSNNQPLYTQDFANDKEGLVVNNKGEVKAYTNMGINEGVKDFSPLGYAKRIISGELSVEEAIEDAKRNAKKNNINSISFFAADVGKFLKEYPNYQGNISTIVLDPPRAGIAPKTLQKVIELGAQNIVYISCNPSTQARDAATLRDAGFELKKYALVDQFPHTGHIESIAKFKRK